MAFVIPLFIILYMHCILLLKNRSLHGRDPIYKPEQANKRHRKRYVFFNFFNLNVNTTVH